MAKQNCKVCEFDHSNMGDGGEGHCYMFKDKPHGCCGQFSPTMREEQGKKKRFNSDNNGDIFY